MDDEKPSNEPDEYVDNIIMNSATMRTRRFEVTRLSPRQLVVSETACASGADHVSLGCKETTHYPRLWISV